MKSALSFETISINILIFISVVFGPFPLKIRSPNESFGIFKLCRLLDCQTLPPSCNISSYQVIYELTYNIGNSQRLLHAVN